MGNRRLLFFVATHKDAPLPIRSEIFAALGLGGYHPTTSLETFDDANGNSISHKNPHYSELTGWYWIWKNVSDVDVVGLCHYRRYFFLWPRSPLWSHARIYLEPTSDNLAMLSATTTSLVVENALSTADVIVPRRIDLQSSLSMQYALCHRPDDWHLFIEAIHKTCPDLSSHVGWFEKTSEAYLYNMMIARKPYFDAYMSRLFAVLDFMERKITFPIDPYQRRIPAFIAERFFTFYLHATEARVFEVPVAISEKNAF